MSYPTANNRQRLTQYIVQLPLVSIRQFFIYPVTS